MQIFDSSATAILLSPYPSSVASSEAPPSRDVFTRTVRSARLIGRSDVFLGQPMGKKREDPVPDVTQAPRSFVQIHVSRVLHRSRTPRRPSTFSASSLCCLARVPSIFLAHLPLRFGSMSKHRDARFTPGSPRTAATLTVIYRWPIILSSEIVYCVAIRSPPWSWSWSEPKGKGPFTHERCALFTRRSSNGSAQLDRTWN